MQLFYEMIYSCSGDECCKISSKRFEWAKKYFCPPESLEPVEIENEPVDTQKRIIFEDYSSGTLNEMMNPFFSQPYITCTNLLYATCFLIVQVFIVALHLRRRK